MMIQRHGESFDGGFVGAVKGEDGWKGKTRSFVEERQVVSGRGYFLGETCLIPGPV